MIRGFVSATYALTTVPIDGRGWRVDATMTPTTYAAGRPGGQPWTTRFRTCVPGADLHSGRGEPGIEPEIDIGADPGWWTPGARWVTVRGLS